MFAHGFNIRFGTIKPPAAVDVHDSLQKRPAIVFAKSSRRARNSALLAVEQDASGAAKHWPRYAKGLGCTRAGVLETTFTENRDRSLWRAGRTLRRRK